MCLYRVGLLKSLGSSKIYIHCNVCNFHIVHSNNILIFLKFQMGETVYPPLSSPLIIIPMAATNRLTFSVLLETLRATKTRPHNARTHTHNTYVLVFLNLTGKMDRRRLNISEKCINDG